MKTELLMVREGFSLRPYGDVAGDLFDRVPRDKHLLVTIQQPRHWKHHQKLWALATKVAKFSPLFYDAQDAVEQAKIHMKRVKLYTLENGRTIVRTESISFAAMDQIAFRDFYDGALKFWAEKIGCDPETLGSDTK